MVGPREMHLANQFLGILQGDPREAQRIDLRELILAAAAVCSRHQGLHNQSPASLL